MKNKKDMKYPDDFKNQILCGDCMEILKEIPDNSIDTIITDPPYFLEFMNKEWDKVNLIEPSFGYWFSGFVDGEGCFRIHRVRNGDYYETHFIINLRKDDKAILEKIKNTLGFGRTQERKEWKTSKPQISFIVNKREDCLKLAELFFRFPLQAKKQREFFKWYEALTNWKCQKKGNRWHGKPNVSAMEKNWQEMKEIREYKENPIPINKQEFFHYLWAKECLRVAKPGATLLCFGGTRTWHRLACAIEDAGWIIKDTIMFLYGQGFPKATDIAKQIDKRAGKEIENKSEFTEFSAQTDTTKHIKRYKKCKECGKLLYGQDPCNCEWRKYKGQSEEAKLWNGWKSHGLKPSWEPILMCVRPNEGSYAENALKYGVAGLNIDGGRVGTETTKTTIKDLSQAHKNQFGKPGITYPTIGYKNNPQGRFPANLLISCICDEVREGKEEIVSIHDAPKGTFAGGEEGRGSIKNYRERSVGKAIIHTNPECPCYILDKQSGIRKSVRSNRGGARNDGTTIYQKIPQNIEMNYECGFNDTGGASRFFYVAKASRSERNMGCEEFYWLNGKLTTKEIRQKLNEENEKNKNNKDFKRHNVERGNIHPTVKSLKLCEYLCLLTKTPKGGIVLDPFAGSGTTCMAAKKIGRDFIGIEKEPEYVKIAEARIKVIPNSLF